MHIYYRMIYFLYKQHVEDLQVNIVFIAYIWLGQTLFIILK